MPSSNNDYLDCIKWNRMEYRSSHSEVLCKICALPISNKSRNYINFNKIPVFIYALQLFQKMNSLISVSHDFVKIFSTTLLKKKIEVAAFNRKGC